MRIKFCPFCGKALSTSHFCSYCGEELRAVIEATDTGLSEAVKASCTAASLESFETEALGNGTYAIVGTKIRNVLFVKIPDCVVAIGDGAFEGSSVIEVTLPDSLILIARRAFANCPYLETVTGLGSHIRVIADEAFADCPHLDVALPEGVRLGKDVIRGTLPDQKTKEEAARAAEEARNAEEARKVDEKRRVETMRQAFEAVSHITDGVLTAYRGNGGNVVIPRSVTGIGESAFRNCTRLTLHLSELLFVLLQLSKQIEFFQ